MTTRIHTSISIVGVLAWKDADLTSLFGRKAREAQALRAELQRHLKAGRQVLPLGTPCEGFDYQTGCPGHPVESRHP